MSRKTLNWRRKPSYFWGDDAELIREVGSAVEAMDDETLKKAADSEEVSIRVLAKAEWVRRHPETCYVLPDDLTEEEILALLTSAGPPKDGRH